MTIYFVAGEVSADNHGAALMRSLRALDPDLKFTGRGGLQMQQIAGGQFKNWIGDAAVLGLWEVLRKYSYFRAQFHQTLNEILEIKPDAIVFAPFDPKEMVPAVDKLNAAGIPHVDRVVPVAGAQVGRDAGGEDIDFAIGRVSHHALAGVLGGV